MKQMFSLAITVPRAGRLLVWRRPLVSRNVLVAVAQCKQQRVARRFEISQMWYARTVEALAE
jgi:hypothetical protein